MAYFPYPTTAEEREIVLFSCRCGSGFPAHLVPEHWTARGLSVTPDPGGFATWTDAHQRPTDGHRVELDRYRTPCRPASHAGGCRECGAPSVGRMHFYCSPEHREAFERDHFWGSASRAAATLASTFMLEITRGAYWGRGEQDGRGRYHQRDAVICRRCEQPAKSWEVNHIVPVAGRRRSFGCEHHQENLEVLCRPCHLEVTAEQRAAGLLGPGAPAVVKARPQQAALQLVLS